MLIDIDEEKISFAKGMDLPICGITRRRTPPNKIEMGYNLDPQILLNNNVE